MSRPRAFARVATFALAAVAYCPHTHAADAPPPADHDCSFADFAVEMAGRLHAATVKGDAVT